MRELYKQFLPLLTLCAACLAFSPTSAKATEEMSVATMRDQIDRAVLVVVSREWSFPRRIGEADLAGRGCRYELTSRAAVAPLMEVLSRSQFSVDENKGGYSLRMGIYLHAKDGGKTTLLFGDSAGDMRGTYNGRAIVVKAPFDAQIRELVAKIAPTEAHYQCEGDSSARLPSN